MNQQAGNFPGDYSERELIRSCLRASLDVLFTDAASIIHEYLSDTSCFRQLHELYVRCQTLLDARARYFDSELEHQPARLERLHADVERELKAWGKAVDGSGLKGSHQAFLMRFGPAMGELVGRTLTEEEAHYLKVVSAGHFQSPTEASAPDDELPGNVTFHAPLQDGLMGKPRIMQPFLELNEHESIAANMYRYGSIFTL